MDKELASKYYSRPEIQKAILSFAREREIGTRFDGFFGKRPDILENTYDIKKFIKKGVLSFHMSEERWLNPLLIGNKKLDEEEKMKNRSGWDLILDLDGVDFTISKITAKIIIDFLNSLDIKNVSTKFSGNKGFHIAIPFEAFSKNIIGIGETKNLFPQAARKIASFITFELKEKISSQVLEHENGIDNISQKYNIPKEELIIEDEKSNNFDFMKVIEIDTILISSRHLFRMPYSLNEKAGLVSIPVDNEKILEFEKQEAIVENVDPQKYQDFEFLKYDEKYGKDADILLVKSFEDNEQREEEFEKRIKRFENIKKGFKKGIIVEGDFSTEIFEIKEEIEIKNFPKTITYILNNNFADGKKRALFVILSYLHSINYTNEVIDSIINEWNEKQQEPLKQNYLQAQLSWFKGKTNEVSPPNFSNDNYYKGIGVPKETIDEDRTYFKGVTIKNPLHHTYIFLQRQEIEKNQKKTKKEKKE